MSNSRNLGVKAEDDLNHEFYSTDIICYKVHSSSVVAEN